MRFLLDKIISFLYPKVPPTEHKPHMVTTTKGKKVNVGGCILKKDSRYENHKDRENPRYH